MDDLFGQGCRLALIFALLSLFPPYAFSQAKLPPPAELAAPVAPKLVRLRELVALGIQHHPQLQRARLEVGVAQGNRLQAGLYPNPELYGDFGELGDRQGRGGINAFPVISQEIVTAHKLKLDQAIVDGTVNQANLAVTEQTFAVVADIRKKFFEYLTVQERLKVLAKLRSLATKSYRYTEQLEKAKQTSKLDVVQLRVDRNRVAARYDSTQARRRATWRELTAIVGVPHLPIADVRGTLEYPLPNYDLKAALQYAMNRHPQVLAAHVGVTKAQVVLRRASVQKIPNVTVGAGYVRQNQNKSDDWLIRFSVPLPVFDRNQGNVLAAQAALAQAHAEVRQAQNDIARKVANAFAVYQSERKRAERYREDILEDAERAYKLALAGFQGGEFGYLRVLAAQRALAEARLEYLESLSKAWQAASDISGLLLERQWPPVAVSHNTTK